MTALAGWENFYVIVGSSALAAQSRPRPAMFLVGAAALLLLFVGIHDAWDAVTYHVFVRRRQQPDAERRP